MDIITLWVGVGLAVLSAKLVMLAINAYLVFRQMKAQEKKVRGMMGNAEAYLERFEQAHRDDPES